MLFLGLVRRALPVILTLVAGISGCRRGNSATSPPSDPPPEIVATLATTKRTFDFREFTGRTSAVDSVEIRARVSGYLLQTPRTPQARSGEATLNLSVDEGQHVKKGDLLFIVDAQPYELALAQSVGSLDAAEARYKQLNNDLTRTDLLLQSNATSRAQYDQAFASVAELRGQIATLKATVARNQLDVDYTQVRSPIDGLLGQTLVTTGNLVAADSTILTTVVSVDPIYVEFDVDEQSVLDYRTRMLDGEVRNARNSTITVRLGLANDDGFPHKGIIEFVNNRTDAETGNTRVRATFSNESGILSPGLFARVQVPFTSEYEAVVVPTNAIAMDQQGRHVMVVNDDKKVARRGVKLGQIEGDMTVVREGVRAGEQVVTSGLQRIRSGALVSLKSGSNAMAKP